MTAISGISNTGNSMQTWQAMIQQRKQDFSQLASALQIGNLTGAQSAFSTLNIQGQNTNTAVNSSSNSSNTISNDFAALEQALQSGDIGNAQSAFAQLQTDMQMQHGSGHHHYHHHHGGANQDANGQNAASSTSLPAGNIINISA
jgi:hypothetical protein